MAQTGKYYPYDATLNPDGYKAGTANESAAKTYWAKPENTNKTNNPFPAAKNPFPAVGPTPSAKPSPSASAAKPSWVTPSNAPTPAPSESPSTGGSDPNAVTSSAPLDDYGNPVEGNLYVVKGGKQVTTTIAAEYTRAFSDVKYLKFVRDQLVSMGQLDAKQREKKDVLKAFRDVLIGASQSQKDVGSYLKELKAAGIGVTSSGSTGPDLTPQRTVTKLNEGTVGDLIKSVYMNKLGQEPTEDEIKTILADFQKQNTGTLTEYKKVKNKKTGKTEMLTTVTPGFSTDLAKTQLEKQLKETNPDEYNRRKAFEFSDSLNQIMSGGM